MMILMMILALALSTFAFAQEKIPLSSHLLSIETNPGVIEFTEGKRSSFTIRGAYVVDSIQDPYRLSVGKMYVYNREKDYAQYIPLPSNLEIRLTEGTEDLKVSWSPPYYMVTGGAKEKKLYLEVTMHAGTGEMETTNRGEEGAISKSRFIALKRSIEITVKQAEDKEEAMRPSR